MITTEEMDMRREALEDAASHAHPDTIPEMRILDDHPDGGIPTNPEHREAVHRWWIDTRFRLAIRAALGGAILACLVACGGRVDASSAPELAPPGVQCSTPEGSSPVPASSVAITRADGSIAVSESCENGAACYVVSAPPPMGRATEILHIVRGSCVVTK
jgi:hypothetical protein